MIVQYYIENNKDNKNKYFCSRNTVLQDSTEVYCVEQTTLLTYLATVAKEANYFIYLTFNIMYSK